MVAGWRHVEKRRAFRHDPVRIADGDLPAAERHGTRQGGRPRRRRIKSDCPAFLIMSDARSPKIYLLPNLMTAGNLFCGFAAVLRIYDGAQETDFLRAASDFHDAIWFILAACIFDLLDGRLARLGGHESPFGREFDSLADIVSFGMAPALLVYQVVLQEFPRACWICLLYTSDAADER